MLWRLRPGLIVSLALASSMALWTVYNVSISPPGLKRRSLAMATASTHVVIDTPTSTLVDLRQDTYSFEALRNRAVLIGNVIASTTVRQNIARQVGIPEGVLRIQAPLTREQSAPPVDSDNARHTSDILKSTDQYRINIQSNPTVPMLDIYAQSPDAKSAATLANAAVDEVRNYLVHLATEESTPQEMRIQLFQLGRAHGTVINGNVAWQAAMLVFLLTFGVSAATVIFLARIRTGWRIAALEESAAEA
jgi:hypothetical protein